MENKSATYWDGWCSHSVDLSGLDNPYSSRTQAHSHNQWENGYWARYHFSVTDETTKEELERLDMFALLGERY